MVMVQIQGAWGKFPEEVMVVRFEKGEAKGFMRRDRKVAPSYCLCWDSYVERPCWMRKLLGPDPQRCVYGALVKWKDDKWKNSREVYSRLD